VCQGLDHASGHNVFHCSLEPSKVMVTWDGTVKILSFGISSTGWVAATVTGAPRPVLHYMSPEQVQGEGLDARSNLFSWGAILYEMVTDQKAFDGSDADEVRHKIANEMPVSPAIVNPKINPVASDVIMKALAKDPAERYQSGRELAADLEKCREATGKTAKKADAPKTTVVSDVMKAAPSAKFASGPKPPSAAKFEPQPPETRFAESSSSLSSELETSWTPAKSPEPPPAAKKAAAAAAGWNSGANSATAKTQMLDPSAQFITSTMKASVDAITNSNASMSAAVVEEPTTEKPRIAVDPMMAEGAEAAKSGVSFSEMDELPPLKEVYVPPPPPKADEEQEPAESLPSIVLRRSSEPEKPKIQPREVAQKAIKEIKAVPPQLLMYSICGAVGLILIVGAFIFWRSMSQSTDEEGRVPAPAAAPVKQQAPVEQAAPAPVAPEPAPTVTENVAPAEAEPEPAPLKAAAPARGRNAKKKTAATPAAAIPGQILIDSAPAGAQFEIDGRTDPNWVTPYTLAGLNPGQHTVTISKSGYAAQTRTVDVVSANKASVVVQLVSLNATINVTSEPVGAAIFVDGKDTLRVTPAVVTLEKGTHTILVRKPGFLDETSSANGQPGQQLHFNAALRPLGNVDDIKTVGKFKKLFGGKGADAGMGKVSIKTTPKGAQIAVNRRMLDKGSPVDFVLSPGNYVVDITLTGYKPVQKVVTIEPGGSIGIDETLKPE
jgi:serine/threonine protein kinase